MAAYEYIAVDAEGRRRKGVISADTQKAARRELRRQALTPLKLLPTRERQTTTGGASGRKGALKARDLVLVTRQLAMLVSSGMPVEEAVASIARTAQTPSVRTVMSSVRAGVVEGQSLSDAMRTEAASFDGLFRSVVSAGEKAGALGKVLGRLATDLEKTQAMQRKVTSALIYPMILSLVALSVVIALMVFVVPRVVEQFDGMGQQLPLLTSVLLSISEFLRSYGLILLGVIVAGVVVFNRLLRSDSVRLWRDGLVLGLPVIGDLTRSVGAARFSRTFATLNDSGATVLDALLAARETTTNRVMRGEVDEIIDTVRKGGALSSAMAKTTTFPPLVVNMAASGEAGGRLGDVFEKGAEYLEGDFDQRTGIALGLLEPLITVVMGGIVLVIILAIMLPILQINSGLAAF